MSSPDHTPHPAIPPTVVVKADARRAIAGRRGTSVGVIIAVALLVLCIASTAVILYILVPAKEAAPPVVPAFPTCNDAPIAPQACNPLCAPLFQTCKYTTDLKEAPSGTQCVNSCGLTTLPMNTMCIGGTTIKDVCMKRIVMGTGTAVILQSQVPGKDGVTYALTARPAPASAATTAAVSKSKSGGLKVAPPVLTLEVARMDNFNQYFTFLPNSSLMCAPTSTACPTDWPSDTECPCNCFDWLPSSSESGAKNAFYMGKFGSDPTPIQCPVPGATPTLGSTANPFSKCNKYGDGMLVPCKNSYSLLVTAPQNPVGPGWVVQAAPTVSSTSSAPVKLMTQEETSWRELPLGQAHLYTSRRNPTLPAKGIWITDVSFDRCEKNRTAVLTAVKGASGGGPTLAWTGNDFPTGMNTATSGLKEESGWFAIPVSMTKEFYISNACEPTVAIPAPTNKANFNTTTKAGSKEAKDVTGLQKTWGTIDACTGKTLKTTSTAKKKAAVTTTA